MNKRIKAQICTILLCLVVTVLNIFLADFSEETNQMWDCINACIAIYWIGGRLVKFYDWMSE